MIEDEAVVGEDKLEDEGIAKLEETEELAEEAELDEEELNPFGDKWEQ